jgi:chromosome segregation ATPase
LEGKVSALQQERDKDGDLILRLNDDCENYKKKINALENAHGDLESHLQEVKTTHTRNLAETKTTLQRQMTFVEEASREEKARMHKMIEEKETHSSEKSRAMNQRISELTDALEMERTENGKKVAAYNILKQKFDNQETEMANMMDDLIAKTNKIRELEKIMRDKGGAEPNEAMQRQSRLQNLRIQELELEIERINRTTVSKTQELEETCKLFQRDLKQQKNLVVQLTKEKEQLLAQNGGTDNAVVQHLQQQLAETKRKYEQSNETVIRLDEALRGALAKQDDFTSKITELKGEIGRLQRKTTRAESFISETTVE